MGKQDDSVHVCICMHKHICELCLNIYEDYACMHKQYENYI